MSLKTQIIADTQIFLNTDEFAEQIIYNGASITAIIEIGETNTKGNSYSSDGHSDQGFAEISVIDIPNPQEGDDIICENGKHWRVARIVESDIAMHRLAIIANEGAISF